MSSAKPKMYIYHLPYEERKKLCFILDQNDIWEQLGLEQMQYDEITIDNIRKKAFRGKSASNELLTLWGNQNHTVLELFILLVNTRLYQAMTALKRFVEDKYHSRIKIDNLNTDIQRLHINNSKVPPVNYDKDTFKALTKNVAITNPFLHSKLPDTDQLLENKVTVFPVARFEVFQLQNVSVLELKKCLRGGYRKGNGAQSYSK